MVFLKNNWKMISNSVTALLENKWKAEKKILKKRLGFLGKINEKLKNVLKKRYGLSGKWKTNWKMSSKSIMILLGLRDFFSISIQAIIYSPIRT